MKPSFDAVKKHYPRPDQFVANNLHDYLGWPDLKDKPAFENTCAIRMSVGLAGANIAIPGRLTIKSGPLRGKSVEPEQAKLSHFLKRLWGAPEIYKSEDALRHGLGNRRGVVSFFRIHGAGNGTQGHIDLIEPNGNNSHACFMACHFQSVEMWFWPLL